MGIADVRDWEDRYRSLFEQAPIGVFMFDRSLRITECNHAFASILGTPPERLVGLDMGTLSDQSPVPAIRRTLEGESSQYRGPYVATTSGRAVVVELKLFPLRDGNGPVVGGVAFVEDVTAQVRADTRLRVSEQRVALHVRNTPLGVIAWGSDGEVVEWNESATRIFGFTAEEAMGRLYTEVIVVPERMEHAKEIREQILQGRPVRTVDPCITKDGRTILCDWYCTPLVGDDGKVAGVATLVLDITEQRRTLDALAQSEARFRELIERAPDAIGVIRDRTLVYVNDAFARALGRDKGELLGTPLRDLVADEDREALGRALDGAPASANAPLEIRFSTQRGPAHLELVTLAHEYDGEPAVMLIGRDVTERKRMQAQLMQADRMVAMGTLAAGVAHEINNPLAYLLANLDLLAQKRVPDLIGRLEHPKGPDGVVAVREAIRRCAEMLDVAREGAERVRDIVRDLRTFSRDDDRRAAVDVRRVLDACVNIAHSELTNHAQLERAYGEVPFSLANESRLGQVFLNLLVNAAQAVASRPREAGPGRIVLTTRSDVDGSVVVEVEDDGPGISDADRAHIFDPFFTTKPAGVGTGLGLWICHGIVTGLGGRLDVESSAGNGALFRVTLPAYGVPSSAPESPRAESVAFGRGSKILVVDDEPQLAEAVREALAEDYEVRVCTDSQEAIALLLRPNTSFDLVLCDLVMPGLTGVELYDEVQQNDESQARRFVFMTGGAITQEAHELLERPGIRKLDKPFDVETLRSVVLSALRRAKL